MERPLEITLPDINIYDETVQKYGAVNYNLSTDENRRKQT
jgi:hypothetical protein